MTWVCDNYECRHNLWWKGVVKPKKVKGTQDFKAIKVVVTPKAEEVHGCMCCIHEPWTLEEIGQLWGFSRERIRQVEESALEKIKKMFLPDLFLIYEEGIHVTEWRTRTIRVLSGKYIQADGLIDGRRRIYREG